MLGCSDPHGRGSLGRERPPYLERETTLPGLDSAESLYLVHQETEADVEGGLASPMKMFVSSSEC